MKISIEKKYLWLPVNMRSPEVKLNMYKDDIKVQEMDIHLACERVEYYVGMDVSKYQGETLELACQACDLEKCDIANRPDAPGVASDLLPHIHFSPKTGWINDPNGLIYADGVYHVFCQYNPYGYEWGNVQWTHSISKDLLRFEDQGLVMEPDEYGTVYSGCAVKDEKNLLGYGKDTLLFYYTAAGGRNDWSKEAGNLFTQRLAYSTDGGKTLIKSDLMIPYIVGENRDPKIFWYDKAQHYVCVLYLDENDFAIFVSSDLRHWEKTQKLTFPGMWECPDLMELNVVNEASTKKWLFFSADGYYVTGNFDGRCFSAASEVQMAYATRLPYAAQSYSGIPDAVVAVPWLRMNGHEGNFRGQMGMPMKLSLMKVKDCYQMVFCPVDSYENMTKRETNLEVNTDQSTVVDLDNRAGELEILFDAEEMKAGVGKKTDIWFGNSHICLDFEVMTAKILSGNTRPLRETNPEYLFDIQPDVSLKIRIIADNGSLEVLAYDGTVYAALEAQKNLLKQKLYLENRGVLAAFTWKYCE